jgi:hypothetical protein
VELVAPISLLPLPFLAEPPWNDKGGEAFIYEHPADKEFLVKVFHVNRVRRGRRGPEAEHLIDLNSFSEGLTPSQSVRLSECFSWPATLYGSSLDCIDGIAIRRAADEFWLDYEDVYGWNHQVQNLAFLGEFLKAPIIKKAPYTDISFEDRIELAMEYLRSMQVLWELGYRYGDYSENNLLWAFEPRPRVFIIDAETCSRPGTKGPRTNGWAPLDQKLGYTLEADRSQCALLIWRVVNGAMSVYPPDLANTAHARNLSKTTIGLINRLYQEGTEQLADALLNDLRQYRGQENINKAFEWAVSTQFANIVLDYAPANPTQAQSDVIRRARDQQLLEQEILALEPNFRRYRLSHAVPVAGFEFDISALSTNVSIEHDAELLRDMALHGDFEQIAEIFAVADQSMTLNRVVTRSIQVAISQFGAPRIAQGVASPNSQRFEWGWPGANYINCARIEIIGPDGKVLNEATAYRKSSKSGVTLPIDDTFPANSVLALSLGLVTPNDQTVFCPLKSEVYIATKPQRRPSGTSTYTPTTTRSPIDVGTRTWSLPPTAPPVPTGQGPGNTQPGRPTPPPAPTSRQQGQVRRFFSKVFGRR